jgi:hypothetical protein
VVAQEVTSNTIVSSAGLHDTETSPLRGSDPTPLAGFEVEPKEPVPEWGGFLRALGHPATAMPTTVLTLSGFAKKPYSFKEGNEAGQNGLFSNLELAYPTLESNFYAGPPQCKTCVRLRTG